MRKRYCLWVALVLMAGTGEPREDSRSREVDALFAPWDGTETPGAVVAVIVDGNIIYQRAYGMADLERKVPLSVHSVFDIASTSKQFVAMGILLLQERGKVALDDDIRRYLPEVPDYGHTITLRHLIHHTSGIRDYMDLMYLAGMKHENSYHTSEIVDLVTRQKNIDFEPGTEFLYSNSGYLFLGEIISRVSGQTLGEFTKRNIFEPLNMKASQFYEDFTRIVEHRALSYSDKETGDFTSVQYIFDVVGDTGLLTNIEDLFLWDQNFYDNTLGRGGPKLIEQMLTPGRLASGEELDYAFGLELEEYRGTRLVKHSGSAAGYRSQLLRFPDERFTVIVLSNLAQFSTSRLAEQVADIYLGESFTAGPQPARERSEPREAVTVSQYVGAIELEAHGGRYYSAELDATYFVRVVDGGLTYRLEHSDADVRLVPTGPDAWAAAEVKLGFSRDPRGRVTGFDLTFGRIRAVSFEKL